MKTTEPPVVVNVPFTVKSPEMVIEFVPVNANEAPASMVKLLAVAATLIIGAFGVPAGITTLVDEVGTPPHQFEASPQLPLLVPVHTPPEVTITSWNVLVADGHEPL